MNPRIKQLQNQLISLKCDAILVEEPTNLYYLTGLEVSLGQLLVHKEGAHLFVDGRYEEICQAANPCTVVLSQRETLRTHLTSPTFASIKRLAFDSHQTSYSRYTQLKTFLPNVELIPIPDTLKQMRAIKEPEELEMLKEAAELGSQGYDYVLSLLKEGVTEREVAAELEIFWKRKGSSGIAFDPIIAFGSHSSMPHYHVADTPLKQGDCVLIDIGVNDRHYHSDMTRVVFFGEPSPKLLEIYSIVWEAQREALKICRPGTCVGKLDQVARDLISKKGYGKEFSHSLGHGVGLEIHEWPLIRSYSKKEDIPLEPGMVITIEPGIYLPKIGGVRLEDTIAITENGYDNLTNRPLEPLILKT